MASALENFWGAHAPAEGVRRIGDLLDTPEDIPPRLRARALRNLAGAAHQVHAFDVADAACILTWLFVAGDAPECVAATNTNADGAATVADASYLLNHLFAGGPAPASPFPDCGTSALEADAGLGCETGCR